MNKGLKLGLKITGITLSVLLVGVILIGQIPTTTLTKSSFNDHSSFFKDIDSKNENFKNARICDISMLGAHDSMSDKIHYSSKPNSSEDNITNNSFVMFFNRGLASRYAKAQNDDVYNQLKSGVRYLDVRITNVDGVFYNSHGFISEPLENNLNMVLKFLDENPKEFIIFDIFKFYKGNSSYKELEDFIKSIKYKEKCLFDYDVTLNDKKDLKDLRYKDVVTNNAGVIIYSNKEEAKETIFYNHLGNTNIYRESSSKSYSKDIILKINEYKDKYNNENAKEKGLVINETQLSTSFSRPFQTLFQWSLLAHAYKHNLNVINQSNIDEILDAMPIYMCDYSTSNSNQFNDKIIKKLEERNLSLK